MAGPVWVRTPDPETGRGRGISLNGEIVVRVQWRPPHEGIVSGEMVPRPAGYYFAVGNIVHTRLLEEADEPSDEDWERMRKRAFKAFEEWQAAQAAATN
jgi:hypothetical protein